MVQFRPQAKEIIAKVVYYGPPLGGKTTNLRTLYRGYPPNTRGELVVVPTGSDRTIFFDFLPVSVGTLRGMNLRVQLYTVPGQVHFNTTRQVVLRGVDGVVFVADSQREMLNANRLSYANLKENLLLQGLALADTPHVMQYNKRDLKDILSVEELDEALNEANAPFFEAVATLGIGVEETLQGVVRLVARSLRERFKLPLEAVTIQDGLFTHVPSQTAGIDRPFETTKLDAPVVHLATGRPPARDEARPAEANARVSPAGGLEKALPSPGEARAGGPFGEPPVEAVSQPEPVTREEDESEEDVVFATTEEPAPEPFPPAAPAVAGRPAAVAVAEQRGERDVFAPAEEAGVSVPPVATQERPAPLPELGVFAEPLAPAPLAVEELEAPQRRAREPLVGGEVFGASVPFTEAGPPPGPPLLVDPYADPFAEEVATAPPCVADVFALDETTAAAPGAAVGEEGTTTDLGAEETGFEPLAPRAVQVEVEERAASEPLVPLPEATVQRVLPRALAQFGEVRELELEVPVPAAWVGGRRMTLQLRLTLVPEEESHVG